MSWSAVFVVAAAVAVIVFSGYLLATWPPDPPAASAPATQDEVSSPAASPTESSTESPAAEDAQQALVVLGDSFSARSPASAGQEWPELLADRLEWEVVREVVDGSGYVSAGQGEPFTERVDEVLAHEPDVVVVAGGVGDVGAFPTQRIARAAENVVTELVEAGDAQVILVSPFSNGEPGPLTAEFSTRLRQIADDQRVPYVDATNWLNPSGDYFGADQDHPNDTGQGVIADEMEQALADLKVTDAQPSEEPSPTQG